MVTDRQGPASDQQAITDRVVKISRVAKVVRGGRPLSFNAVVVDTSTVHP